jgi:hypothetical protein
MQEEDDEEEDEKKGKGRYILKGKSDSDSRQCIVERK